MGGSEIRWTCSLCKNSNTKGEFFPCAAPAGVGVQVVNYEPNTAARMHTDWIEAGFAKHGFKFDRELQDRIWHKPGAFKLEGEVLSN
jgi:hypothetical protein